MKKMKVGRVGNRWGLFESSTNRFTKFSGLFTHGMRSDEVNLVPIWIPILWFDSVKQKNEFQAMTKSQQRTWVNKNQILMDRYL